MTKVLSIVHRVISSDYIKRAGLSVKSGAQTGAVTLVQRSESALNLNRNAAPPHLHILVVDGAFSKHAAFYSVKPPSKRAIDAITHKIAQRVARYLEKAGYLVRGAESDYLDLQADDDDAMATLIGASSEASLVRHPGRSYWLAFGPNAGRKAMTLQTIPATTTTSTTEDLISRQSEGGPQASRCMRALSASPPRGKSWNVRAALRFAGILPGLLFLLRYR